MDNKDFTNLEYVINTGKCKIMKFSPWDSVIQQFLNKNMKPIDCSKNNNSNSTGWAYQDGTVCTHLFTIYFLPEANNDFDVAENRPK